MRASPVRWFSLARTWRELRLAWRLLRDPRVPAAAKLIPLAAAAYIAWPWDLATDAWPVVGQLDDVAVLLLSLRLFLLATGHGV
jgi:uncharacterized membrane protein YkvA (DUF1232 family)